MNQELKNMLQISNDSTIQHMFMSAISYSLGDDLWPTLEQRYEIMQNLINNHKDKQLLEEEA